MARARTLLLVAFLLIGFLAATAVRTRPADPEGRLPRQFRLAALIEREQKGTVALRGEVEQLRRQVDALRRDASGRQAGAADQEATLRASALAAGLVALRGPGLRITLDDAERSGTAPQSANVNDLVVHSQDVQAVVNAAWRAGAEAVSINGQRLVSTSAVLCVGNTLLLNGTVHSPPYVVSAIGATRDRFEPDALVRRLHDDAKTFGLRFSVSRDGDLSVPAFGGATSLRYARPAG